MLLRGFWCQEIPLYLESTIITACLELLNATLLANFCLHLSDFFLYRGYWSICRDKIFRVELQIGRFRCERFMLLLIFTTTATLFTPHLYFKHGFHIGLRLCALFSYSKQSSDSFQVYRFSWGNTWPDFSFGQCCIVPPPFFSPLGTRLQTPW